jgi:sugar lactone lactonase YvrE
MRRKPFCLLLASLGLLQACAAPPGSVASGTAPVNPVPRYPDVITVERGGFTPEGIEYDQRNQRFLLGSVVEGRVFALDARGRLTTLVDDPDLDAVVGIEVEEARNRLLVVSADAAVFAGQSQGAASVGIYALDSGARIALIDLDAAWPDAPEGTRFFPNDVAGDSAGNIYVTDSFALVVYKVDTALQPSVFVRREQFPDGQSLNGIVVHPDGYLLIAGSGTGAIYKADVRNPRLFGPVGLPEPIAGADGMVWSADGTLVIAARGRTVKLRSSDNWVSARIVAEVPQGAASTVATVGSESYLVFPHFADQDPPTVERVAWP